MPAFPVGSVSTGPNLATRADLEALLQATFTPAQATAADILLASASAAIRRAAGGQVISLVVNDVANLQGNWTRELVLPQWPVISVSAVTINGGAVATGTWALTGTGKLYRGYLPIFNGPDDWGGDLFLGSWLGPVTTVGVTYTHGFATIPEDVKAICLAAAARAFGNPGGDKAESIGNYSVTHGDQVRLMDDEMDAIRSAYRRFLA